MINVNLNKKIKLAINYPKVAVNTLIDPIFNKNKTTKFPRLINCFITEKCNFNCPMCHVVTSRLKHLNQISLKTIKKIADESTRYGVSFQLSGGEPLLHPEIIDIIKYLHKKKIPTSLVTNGLLLEKYAQKIIDSKLDFLAISLDGPDEKTQYQRGYVKNSFKQIIKGIKKIVELRGNNKFPNIRIATVITKSNLHNFDKIYPIVKKLKADQWSISHFFFYYNQIKSEQQKFYQKYKTGNDIWGQNLDSKKEYLNFNEQQILKNKIKKISSIKNKKTIISINNKIDINKYYSGVKPSKKSNCTSPFQQVFLRGNGDVEICHGFIAGNINKQPLIKIWHNQKVNQFRKIFLKLKTIPACFRCCALDIKFDK
jgi:MoaA/NifB/PqqE/SkfB family radical SAM enzyme